MELETLPVGSIAERLRSRSSGGKLSGCVSVGYRGWSGCRDARSCLRKRGSFSFPDFDGDLVDLTGDLDDDLVAEECWIDGMADVLRLFGVDSLPDLFFGDDLEKKVGRTMEVTAPG